MESPLDACKKILQDFNTDPEAEGFLEPVPWREWELLDYPRIIKQPMDLGTITRKFSEGRYRDIYEFAYDMRLIWRNCLTYNQESADIYTSGKKLSEKFEERFSAVEAMIPTGEREPSAEMKREFVDNLYKVSSKDLSTVIQMINEKCESALDKTNPELIDIIVDAIDTTTFYAVNTYVKSRLEVDSKTMEEENA